MYVCARRGEGARKGYSGILEIKSLEEFPVDMATRVEVEADKGLEEVRDDLDGERVAVRV